MREIAHHDFTDFSPIEGELSGFVACFFCLGVSSIGMNERDYRRVTYDFALAAGHILARPNPNMDVRLRLRSRHRQYRTGVHHVGTGEGPDRERAIPVGFQVSLRLSARIHPARNGIVPKTAWLRGFYAVLAPLYPVWKALFPKYVTTTSCMGKAMIHVAREGAPRRVLENRDINEICGGEK